MIPPISAIGALPVPQVAGPAAATVTPGVDFGGLVSNSLQQLQDLQSTSDNLAVKAATGDLTDIHDYMIASNEASVATSLTVAVRNKAVDAFNEIMRMQM